MKKTAEFTANVPVTLCLYSRHQNKVNPTASIIYALDLHFLAPHLFWISAADSIIIIVIPRGSLQNQHNLINGIKKIAMGPKMPRPF